MTSIAQDFTHSHNMDCALYIIKQSCITICEWTFVLARLLFRMNVMHKCNHKHWNPSNRINAMHVTSISVHECPWIQSLTVKPSQFMPQSRQIMGYKCSRYQQLCMACGSPSPLQGNYKQLKRDSKQPNSIDRLASFSQNTQYKSRESTYVP